MSLGRSPWASVTITQRWQGPVTARRTSSPSRRVRPTHAFSRKPAEPGVSTRTLGRNRRVPMVPSGYSSCSRARDAVVSTCTAAESKNVPSERSKSVTGSRRSVPSGPSRYSSDRATHRASAAPSATDT